MKDKKKEQVKMGLLFLLKLLRRLVMLPTEKKNEIQEKATPLGEKRDFRDVELKVPFVYEGRDIQCLAHRPA